MTSEPLNDDPQNDDTPNPGEAKTSAGRRPDEAGPGQDRAEPATGGEGAAGAGGPGGFGT